MDAFAEACKYMNNLRLVLIGQGNIQELSLNNRPFNDKITFKGFLMPAEIKEFYQITDIGVIPSLYDHCPYTVLEMISYQIPLILSKINGLNEILEENQCVFVSYLNTEEGEVYLDIKELCNAILCLARDNEMAKNIASNAFKEKLFNFSAYNMVSKMNNVYSTFLQHT
ncbi:MAG: glycosyltransferase [Chloroflexia bacterium]|nr:glycosyltransferase [Chloroflexia bacterium]